MFALRVLEFLVGLFRGFFYSAFSQVIFIFSSISRSSLHIKMKEHSSSLFFLPNSPHVSSTAIANVVLINMKSSNKIQVSLRNSKNRTKTL